MFSIGEIDSSDVKVGRSSGEPLTVIHGSDKTEPLPKSGLDRKIYKSEEMEGLDEEGALEGFDEGEIEALVGGENEAFDEGEIGALDEGRIVGLGEGENEVFDDEENSEVSEDLDEEISAEESKSSEPLSRRTNCCEGNVILYYGPYHTERFISHHVHKLKALKDLLENAGFEVSCRPWESYNRMGMVLNNTLIFTCRYSQMGFNRFGKDPTTKLAFKLAVTIFDRINAYDWLKERDILNVHQDFFNTSFGVIN